MTQKHYSHESLTLYHRDVYFPPALVAQIQQRYLSLTYSKHAQGRVLEKRLPHLPFITCQPKQIIEIGLHPQTKAIESIVYREPWTATHDVLVSVAPNFATGWARVKTIWANERKDQHYSLDASRYVPNPAHKKLETQKVVSRYLTASPAALNPALAAIKLP